MEKNMGGFDRSLRAVLGVGLIGGTLMGVVPVWGWIGIVPLATAGIGWCPLYRLFGFRTCSMPTAKA